MGSQIFIETRANVCNYIDNLLYIILLLLNSVDGLSKELFTLVKRM